MGSGSLWIHDGGCPRRRWAVLEEDSSGKEMEVDESKPEAEKLAR